MAESAPASGEAASEHQRDPSEDGEHADSKTAKRDEQAAALAELAARVDPVPDTVVESARRALGRRHGKRRHA